MKKNKRNVDRLSKTGGTSRNRLALWVLMGALAWHGGANDSLWAQSPHVIPDADGVVTLQSDTSRNYFEAGEVYPDTTDTYTGLTFGPASELTFTNKAQIGKSETNPIERVDASTIGAFTNTGTIYWNEALNFSALVNRNGTIQGTDGTIIVAGDVNNYADGGQTALMDGANTFSTGGDLSNGVNGEIKEMGEITVLGSLTNDGILGSIDGTEVSIDSINVRGESLTNHGTIRQVDSLDVSGTADNFGVVDNFGTMEYLKTITSVGLMTNSGTISHVTTVLDARSGLINSATISNVEKISTTSLTNSGTLEDVAQVLGNVNNNGGTLKLTGSSQMVVDQGTLTNNGGTFEIDISTDGSVGTYAVRGKAIVDGGTLVANDVSGGTGDYKAGDKFTFLTSTELTVTNELAVDFQPVNPLNPLLKAYGSYDAQTYSLLIDRARKYGPGATTWNQKQFGNYLDDIGMTTVPGSDLEQVLLRLDALSPTEEITPAARYAMSQMDGAVYGSMATMEVQNMSIVNNTLANYLRPKDVFCCGERKDSCCANGASPCPGLNMWGSFYGVDGYANGDGNAFGGDYSVSGVLVGGDRSFTPNFRLGGFFAFGDTEYQVNGLNEQANSDSYKAGLYFVHHTTSGYLFGNFNYGWDNFSMSRNITFLGRTNTAKTSGNEWAFRIEKGFNCPLRNSVFQPFGAFQYLSLDTNEFNETGEGATALHVAESDYDSWRTEFGGRLLWGFEGESRTGNLFLQTSWIHEYGDTHGTVNSSFSNPNQSNYAGNAGYTVSGVDLGRDWCNLGVGGHLTQNNFTIFGGYDFMVSGRQGLHTGNVGIAYQF
ncbi:MAG: autotransporter domain-containing protein [Thermoguttaceae bacterium]|nr:autotransporter domain-containing protein [Thermoguttaceae bacterium]